MSVTSWLLLLSSCVEDAPAVELHGTTATVISLFIAHIRVKGPTTLRVSLSPREEVTLNFVILGAILLYSTAEL